MDKNRLETAKEMANLDYTNRPDKPQEYFLQEDLIWLVKEAEILQKRRIAYGSNNR